MEILLIVVQLFISAAMVDVWLIRYDKPQRARGGDATTMVEEFRVYGLPDWFRNVVRVLKLLSGALLIIGLWIPMTALAGGIALVVLMGGAIAMHAKAGDPFHKYVPATTFFLLSCFVVYARLPEGTF